MSSFLQTRPKLSQCMMFAKELIKSPRSMGTLCPSGDLLAKTMASKVPSGNGLVVEIGAGTGAVTAALLQNSAIRNRLLVLERSACMVKLLRTKFPDANIIHGDAAHLSSYLNAPVDCIVSSLPFVSLPTKVRNTIIAELRHCLGRGTMVQFTYAFGRDPYLSRAGFNCLSTTTVWRNMPPARVMEFTVH